MDFYRQSAGRLCLVLLTAWPLHAAMGAAPEPAAAPAQQPVAQVGGQAVRQELLDALIDANAGRPNPFDEESAEERQQRSGARAALDRKALLGELVTMELMAQEAVKLRLHQAPGLVAEAELAYKTLLQRDLVRHMLSSITVTDDDIAQQYERVPAEHEYRIASIDVAGEAAGKRALAELRQGKRFADVARRWSRTPRAAAAPAWLMTAQMEPALAAQVAGMAAGQAIAWPMPQGGSQVVQLIATKPLPKPPVEQLRGGLRMQIMQARLAQRIEAMKSRAEIRLAGDQSPPAQQSESAP